MDRFHKVLGTRKPIIAMAHLKALPGSPLYDKRGGVDGITEALIRDVESLQQGGVDAIMFGNEGDRPYLIQATAESLAAMAAIVTRACRYVRIPFGVNYLWDPVASVALAHATGAVFVREVFTGVYDSDMGLWAPDAAGAVRLRTSLGDSTLLFYNINAEFASPMGNRPLRSRAESAVFAGLADVVCVSGPMTGQVVETSQLQEAKAVLPTTPVVANTGVNIDNVSQILEVADGVIIGTSLKIDGVTWNPVDQNRVERFMGKVEQLRSSS